MSDEFRNQDDYYVYDDAEGDYYDGEPVVEKEWIPLDFGVWLIRYTFPEQLAARGISVVEGEAAAVEGTNDRLRSPQAAASRSLT